MQHSLVIPKWAPARLNQFIARHWAVGHKLKKLDKELVAWYARVAEIPVAIGKRRVSLKITLEPRQRAFDPDAPLKSLLDALVAAKLLVDDSPKWCEVGTVEFERGTQRQTEILLQEL